MKSISIGQGLLFFAYFLTKLTQTYNLGYVASALAGESEIYRETLCNGHWLGNKRHMSSAVIMLTIKPLIITACSFSIVSVQIFLTVSLNKSNFYRNYCSIKKEFFFSTGTQYNIIIFFFTTNPST